MSETTLPDINAKQMSKKYKVQTYGFFAFSWLLGFALIFIIPKDIMDHSWAQQFVGWVGSVVPMVEDLEQIRLHGFADPYTTHLTVLSNISFYYALLWVYAIASTPYMMHLMKGTFSFNKKEKLFNLQVFIDRYHNNKKWYYFAMVFLLLVSYEIYMNAGEARRWIELRYIYQLPSGIFGYFFTSGVVALLLQFFQTHFLIKQQEKYYAEPSK